MAKKKVCKKCKVFVSGGECPICKSTNFSTSWQGRIVVIDPEKSDIAKIMEYKEKAEYCIKAR